MKRNRFHLSVVALAGALAIAACGKLTSENYNKLQVGMTFAEVKQIIGTPDNCKDMMALKRCAWSDGGRSITVDFMMDKAVWLNAENLR